MLGQGSQSFCCPSLPGAGMGTCKQLDTPVAEMKGNFLLGSFSCRIF